MKKAIILNKITANILFFVYICLAWGICLVHATPQYEEPFFMGEIRMGNIFIIGRLSEADNRLIYNGIRTNDFSLMRGCNNYSNIYALQEKVKLKLSELTGQGVVIAGKMKKVEMVELLKENSTSECAEELSSLKPYYYFLEAHKVSTCMFYEASLPKKTNWDEPLKVTLEVKNPFPEDIDQLQLSVYSSPDIYSQFEERLWLAVREKKSIPISLDLIKPGLAKARGANIRLAIYGYSQKEDTAYVVLFNEEIANYNSQGLLEEHKGS